MLRRGVGDAALRRCSEISVGADAYIGPPGLIQHLLLTVSLRSQCEHWLWQSVLLIPCAKGITDSHDQSADWSRNDIVTHKVCVGSNASARPTHYSPLLRFCRVWVFSCEIYTICL